MLQKKLSTLLAIFCAFTVSVILSNTSQARRRGRRWHGGGVFVTAPVIVPAPVVVETPVETTPVIVETTACSPWGFCYCDDGWYGGRGHRRHHGKRHR